MKPRKPRSMFKSWLLNWELVNDMGAFKVSARSNENYVEHLCSYDLRRLVNWLTKCAEYLDAKEKGER